MNKLLQMQVLVEVIHSGSFVSAADALGMSKAAISRHVADLESRLGVRLLQRTTRTLSITEEGQIFFNRCKDILQAVTEAEDEITAQTRSASGLLRISAPVTFGVRNLAPLWGAFRRLHPKVSLDITLADRHVDLIEEGYDIAIRIGQLANSSLVCKKLSTTRMILCASPDYLQKRGVPKHPYELTEHEILAYSYWFTGDEWSFEGPMGSVSVRTRPSLTSNSGDTCRAAALDGQGIIFQPDFMVDSDLSEGTLVALMPDYKAVELGIYAIYPTRKHISAKVRALIDFLSGSFQEDPSRF